MKAAWLGFVVLVACSGERTVGAPPELESAGSAGAVTAGSAGAPVGGEAGNAGTLSASGGVSGSVPYGGTSQGGSPSEAGAGGFTEIGGSAGEGGEEPADPFAGCDEFAGEWWLVYFGDPSCEAWPLVPNVGQFSGDQFCVCRDGSAPCEVIGTFVSTATIYSTDRYWEKTADGCEIRSGAPVSFPAGFYLIASAA